MDERRLFLALALSLVVLTLYPRLVRKPQPSPSPAPAAEKSAATAIDSTKEAQRGTEEEPEADAVARVAAESEHRVELVTEDAVVAFSNRGARVLSWKLTNVTDHEGEPEEMVGRADGIRPLDILTDDPRLDRRIREALFVASAELLDTRRGGAPLTFWYADAEIAVTKELRVTEDRLIRVTATVARKGKEVSRRVVWGPGLGNPSDEEKSVRGFQPAQAVSLRGRKVTRQEVKKLGEAPQAIPDLSWIGIETTYFAALLVPEQRLVGEVWATVEDGKEDARNAVVALDLGRTGGPVSVYVGPKDYFHLREVGHSLKEVVPVGDWIGPIVVPLLGLLRWVQKSVGSYGWSIVLLTVVINLAMAPFRHFSIVNGLKMAKMAPEMKVIQERYRKIPMLDPRRQQMQKEMGELYQKHGMSMGSQMAVGCLPLLLTMPFLFAFYRVLQVSVELRGAPFLWIPDLSQKDPLFLTPILMGVSMVLMQRLTPTTMDPAQQRIMMIMPLVFVVMFFAAPAGLNLYWLSANVCSIVQQLVTMRLAKGAGLSAAPRKVRRA